MSSLLCSIKLPPSFPLSCKHARTHMNQATQANHQNEVRCGLCFSVTAAATLHIWLAGCSSDAGSKAGSWRRAATPPHMQTMPRRCQPCGTKLPTCRAAPGGRKKKSE